jgi:hypothetical protein
LNAGFLLKFGVFFVKLSNWGAAYGKGKPSFEVKQYSVIAESTWLSNPNDSKKQSRFFHPGNTKEASQKCIH